MTIHLENPAVSFLFFGGFAVWTSFVAWAFSDAVDKWPGFVSLIAAAVSCLVAVIALWTVVAAAI
jgi:hypothetical protein